MLLAALVVAQCWQVIRDSPLARNRADRIPEKSGTSTLKLNSDGTGEGSTTLLLVCSGRRGAHSPGRARLVPKDEEMPTSQATSGHSFGTTGRWGAESTPARSIRSIACGVGPLVEKW